MSDEILKNIINSEVAVKRRLLSEAVEIINHAKAASKNRWKKLVDINFGGNRTDRFEEKRFMGISKLPFFSPQVELSGDEATLQVLEATEAKVADEVSQELEQLAERQIEHQAALDVKQAEEMIALEQELTTEKHTGGQQVSDQIEQQKVKVRRLHWPGLNGKEDLSRTALNCAFTHVITEHDFQPKQKKVFAKNRVQFPEDQLGTPTWLPFLCLGTPTWPP